jgi:hypothetical protein
VAASSSAARRGVARPEPRPALVAAWLVVALCALCLPSPLAESEDHDSAPETAGAHARAEQIRAWVPGRIAGAWDASPESEVGDRRTACVHEGSGRPRTKPRGGAPAVATAIALPLRAQRGEEHGTRPLEALHLSGRRTHLLLCQFVI